MHSVFKIIPRLIRGDPDAPLYPHDLNQLEGK